MRIRLCSALLAAACAGVALAEDARRESMRQLILIEAAEVTDPVVAYCRSSAPAVLASLDQGYAHYASLMGEARKAWLGSLSEEDLADAPTPEDLRELTAHMKEAGVKMLALVRTRDPGEYCPALAARLGAYTPVIAAGSVAAQAGVNAARQRSKR